MIHIENIVFFAVLILVTIPVMTFFVQIILSLLPYKKRSYHIPPHDKTDPTVVILIPAHNESAGIIQTLLSVNAQVTPNIKILVVADNCVDDTAEVAMKHGAEVIERFNDTKRGKGYALDFGIQYLTDQAPDIVIILDADCLFEKDAVAILVGDAIAYQRPIQSLNLMYGAANAPLKIKIAEFAWVVKNWARPLGFHRLGLPCQLMGSGMAFPWAAIKQVNLATGHIVEDMKLGVDLAKLNLAPRFCPEALITSNFPANEEGIKTQRTRWEHGHIGMILKEGPQLIWQSLRHTNGNMLALALDLCVPPLALLVILISLLSILALVMCFATQHLLPWGFAFVEILLVGVAVILAWIKFGQSILAFSVLLMAPLYVMMKIPLYIRFIFKRQTEWVRSKRDS